MGRVGTTGRVNLQMELFNNREIAVAMWGALLIAWAATQSPVRKAFRNILRAFARKRIIVLLCMMGAYVGLLVFALHIAGLWDTDQLKNTIIWTVSIATLSFFRINSIVEDPRYNWNAIRDNLRLIVVLEFLIAFYAFDLWVELLIVPCLLSLGIMSAVAELDKKHEPVKRLLKNSMALLGLGLVAHALYKLAIDFRSFATVRTLSDFYLPPLLSLLYLPFLFVLALYVNYENTFVRVRLVLKDSALAAYARRRAIISFHFQIDLLKRWKRNLSSARLRNRSDIDDSILEIKHLRTRERNPEPVPYERGWSPYLASEFLAAEGLHAGDYHRITAEVQEWYAASPYLEIGTDTLPNNIAYYIEGSELAATTLKLVMNVTETEFIPATVERFITIAQLLFEAALDDEMPNEIVNWIETGMPGACCVNRKEVVVLKERCLSPRFDGYTLKFIVRNDASSGAGASD